MRIYPLLPQAKSAAESIGVISSAAVWRQLFQFLNIASSQNYIIGFKGGDQARHHIHHITPPLFLASFFECCAPHVVLVGALLVREMAKLHRFDDAIHNQRRAEAGAQPQEEHLAALIAAQRLHGRVINDLDGTAKCAFKIKSDPPGRQVMRVGDRPVLHNRAGISHGDSPVFPPFSKPLDASNHLLRRHLWSRGKLPWCALPGDKDLHVSSADIDYQHIHAKTFNA